MGFFDKIKTCKVVKEGSTAEKDIAELKELLAACPEAEKVNMEQVIRNLEYGMKGEQSILFELKNSNFPMIVLQDLYLEHEDGAAQIDFLILTRGKNYIIESKNMYGDVTITDRGDFYRKVNGNSTKIYSPITQCERHADIIRKIRYDAKSNFIMKKLFEKFGFHNYCPLVVMANPASKINTKYAPDDIKDKVISVDQLVRYIKMNHNAKDESPEQDMVKLGDFFLSIHRDNPQNYMKKYRNMKTESTETVTTAVEEVKSEICEKPREMTEAQTVPVPNAEITETQTVPTADAESSLPCQRCGGTMVLRVAKKGNNIGEKFYGCNNFPKCRNIQKIEGV